MAIHATCTILSIYYQECNKLDSNIPRKRYRVANFLSKEGMANGLEEHMFNKSSPFLNRLLLANCIVYRYSLP